MRKRWKLLTTSLIVALSLASPQVIQGMEEVPANPPLPWEIIYKNILVPIVYKHCERNDPKEDLNGLRHVIRGFNKDITIQGINESIVGAKIAWLEETYRIKDEADKKTLRQFVNGKLICALEICTLEDGKKWAYKFSNLPNILEASIPSNPHDEANEYLCFNTGYRKIKKIYAKIYPTISVVELWLAPRFLLEQSGRYVEILKVGNKPEHPICELWTNECDDVADCPCDFLTESTPLQISSKDQLENWMLSGYTKATRGYVVGRAAQSLLIFFHVHFVN